MAWITKSRIRFFVLHRKHPRKIINYMGLLIAYVLKWRKIPFLPVVIDIESNNTCNFKCPHCQVTHWGKERAYLDKKSFEKLLYQLPHLTNVKLQGMGEPLLNRQFIPMLESGERRKISMKFFTNGSVCNHKTAERLLTLKNTHIVFSIDGASAEVFEKIRVRSKFEQIKQNIQYLTQIRGTKKQPVISAWCVINRYNVHELPKIVKITNDLRLDSVTLQTFLNDWGKSAMKKHISLFRLDPNSELLTTALKEAMKVAKENHINLRIKYDDFYSKRRVCTWPWTSAYIASNGDVVPCCILADSNIVTMGNVFIEDFSEIWNSYEYQDFRERHRSHNLPDYCKHCYVDVN